MSKLEDDFELAKRKIEGARKLLQEVVNMKVKLTEKDVEPLYNTADHLLYLARLNPDDGWANSCAWEASGLGC